MILRTGLALAALFLLCNAQAPQSNPKKPSPPPKETKKPTPPVRSPAPSPPTVKPGFPGLPPTPARRIRPRHRIKGSWRIKNISSIPAAARLRGYLVFTDLHLSFHIIVQHGDEAPVTQSGFWRYTRQGNRLKFTKLLETGRDPREARASRTTLRTYQFLGDLLRLTRLDGSYMDLQRME